MMTETSSPEMTMPTAESAIERQESTDTSNLKTMTQDKTSDVVDKDDSANETPAINGLDDDADIEAGSTPQPPRPIDDTSKQDQPDRNDETLNQEQQEQKRRQLNPKFKDVRETGKWGSISRNEIMCVIALILAIIIAIIVVVVVLVVKGKNDSNSSNTGSFDVKEHNPSPTAAPTASLTPEESYQHLIQVLQKNSLTSSFADALPKSYSALPAAQPTTGSTDAITKSAIYAMQQAKDDVNPTVLSFALAHFYYSTTENGSTSWTNDENWLDPETNFCKWHGINCNIASGDLDEIDVANNGLHGTIPESLSLMSTLRILWLNGNKLTGTVPGDVFASLPALFILYLQNNDLTGSIPTNLQDNSVLHTLFVQGNNFTGIWPINYCPDCDTQGQCDDPPFLEFGLNCTQTPCTLQYCCDPDLNCYI